MPDPEIDQITDLLRQGWGVEYIAAITGMSIDQVRDKIKIMRGDGRLAAIYPLKIDEAKNA